jgi:hypothetical protein
MPVPEAVVIGVYVMADEFQAAALPPVPRTGGQRPALHRSEVLTLALLAQLGCFPSERAFWRFADAEWRHLFPRLPHRSQLNRAVRAQRAALVAFGRWVARRLDALTAEYEVLDRTAVPLRNAKRRGVGAMPEVVAHGRSLRLGWYQGVRLLVAATPAGVVTGWGIAPGNEPDRALADVLLAERAAPVQALPSAGRAASGVYLADTGFAGRAARARWAALGADVLAPPQRDSRERWPRAWRALHQRRRQIVETVFARLHGPFRLERDRPRSLGGLLTRIAAKVALSNALIRLNRDAGRPGLTLAGLVI